MNSQNINQLLWLRQHGFLKEYDPRQFSINYTDIDISIILDLDITEVRKDIQSKVIPIIEISGDQYVRELDLLDYVFGKRTNELEYYLSKLHLHKKMLIEGNFTVALPKQVRFDDIINI